MKILKIIIFITLILTSCKSKYRYFPDYSGDATHAIIMIKKEIYAKNQFQVSIINSHGGFYQIDSNILTRNDSIIIKNHINNAFIGIESDTILRFKTNEFIEKIDYELKIAKKQFGIAGNHQAIKVVTNDTTKVFYTKKGLGLMGILRDGKHVLTISE